MAKYRNELPQLSGGSFLTDGGIETTLIFHEGLELPDFAAFHLLRMVISGCVGPRGDGYNPTNVMSAEEAQLYHSMQIVTFSETDADMVTAITMNYVEEAIGITRAAKSAGMPVVISFTVETDGKLPTGQTLKNAIEGVDDVTQ